MMYAMLFHAMPFKGRTEAELTKNIIEQPVKIPKNFAVTDQAIDFLKKCLDKDPKTRIKTRQMVIHDWFLMCDDEIEEETECLENEIKEKLDKNEEAKAPL